MPNKSDTARVSIPISQLGYCRLDNGAAWIRQLFARKSDYVPRCFIQLSH